MSGFARRLQQGIEKTQVSSNTIAQDNFNRADGSIGSSEAGSGYTSQPWSMYGTALIGSMPTWVITSGTAALSTAAGTESPAVALLPVSCASGTIFCDMYLSAGSANTGLSLLGASDGSSYLNIQLNESDAYDRIAISKRASGSTTWLQEDDAAALVNGNGYSVAAVLTESQVVVYVDGVQRQSYNFTVQDKTDLTGTYVGLRSWFGGNDDDGGSRWDRFLVTSDTSVPAARTPAAPWSVTASNAGSGQVTILWAAGGNGGSALTGYKITSSDSSVSPVIVSDPIATSYTFSGLNNVVQTFTIQAINAIGTSSASLPSNSVTPSAYSVPGAPTNVSATAGDTQATVSWMAPASGGGSPITSYTVTSSPGNITASSGGVTSAVVSGLINGTSYTFTVAATNGAGTGPASSPSNSITPVASGGGSGTNSSGTNNGEFGAGTFAGYRSAVNTGPFAVFDSGLGRNVQMSDLTNYSGNNSSGDISFTTNNATYFRQIIRADRITVPASGVQFIQCHIKSNDGSRSKSGSYFINCSPSNNVVKFIDCEIDGNGQSGNDVSPYPSGYGFESMFTSTGSPYMLRCNVHGSVDIMKSGHGAYIGYTWLHGNIMYFGTASKETHSDHMQIAASSSNDYTIEYCTMGTPKSVAQAAGTDWTQYETYGINSKYNFINGGMVQMGAFSSSQTVTNLLMRYNYSNDGAFAFHGSVDSAGHADGLFTGNRVGPYMQFGAVYGRFWNASLDGSKYTHDGTNVYDDNYTAYWDGNPRTKDQVFA
jgi:hypothetical protein